MTLTWYQLVAEQCLSFWRAKNFLASKRLSENPNDKFLLEFDFL
jgi:hypothetical protein